MKSIIFTAVAFLSALVPANRARGELPNPGLIATANAASDIVVAEAGDTHFWKALGGLQGTTRLTVIRSLKGPLEPGDTVDVPYLLYWIETVKYTHEDPKFEKGKRYTVFLTKNQNSYELTDQWMGVLSDYPQLDRDIFYSLNEVGDLLNDYKRRTGIGPIPSRSRVDVIPDKIVNRNKGGLVLRVKITNHSTTDIRTRLAHEWHGGRWPPTDLYASVSTGGVPATQPAAFEPVYLMGEQQSETKETLISPGKSVTVDLRMDWPGTGSQPAKPLMSLSRYDYAVRVLVVFQTAPGSWQYATGPRKLVWIAAE